MPDIGKEKLVSTSEVFFPDAVVVADCSSLTNEQWKELRKLGIGGSDAAVIMECSPWKTKKELYYEKIGAPVLLDLDEDKWFIYEYGHAVEELVAKMFQRKTGFEVMIDTRMYRHPKYPFMQANVDRVVRLPDGRIAILECKTTTFFNKEEWYSGPPRYYEMQCRHYMAVCNVDVVYIACLFGNTPADFVCHRIERDLDYESDIIEAEKEFWENNVLAGIEPEYSGDGEMDIAVLRKYGGPANIKIPPVVLEKEYIPQVKKYLAVVEQRKKQEALVEALKQQEKTLQIPFWEALGTATKGIIEIPEEPDSYYEISISPRSRTNVDTDRLRLVYPDAYNECVSVKEESCRVFSLSKKKKKKEKIKS